MAATDESNPLFLTKKTLRDLANGHPAGVQLTRPIPNALEKLQAIRQQLSCAIEPTPVRAKHCVEIMLQHTSHALNLLKWIFFHSGKHWVFGDKEVPREEYAAIGFQKGNHVRTMPRNGNWKQLCAIVGHLDRLPRPSIKRMFLCIEWRTTPHDAPVHLNLISILHESFCQLRGVELDIREVCCSPRRPARMVFVMVCEKDAANTPLLDKLFCFVPLVRRSRINEYVSHTEHVHCCIDAAWKEPNTEHLHAQLHSLFSRHLPPIRHVDSNLHCSCGAFFSCLRLLCQCVCCEVDLYMPNLIRRVCCPMYSALI
eukprot:Opistho-2@20284